MTVLGTRIMMPQQRGWNKHEGDILLDDLTFLFMMEQLFVETLKKTILERLATTGYGIPSQIFPLTKTFLLVIHNTSTTVVFCQYCRLQANPLQVDCLFTFLLYLFITNILLHLNKCTGFTIRMAFLGNLKGESGLSS